MSFEPSDLGCILLIQQLRGAIRVKLLLTNQNARFLSRVQTHGKDLILCRVQTHGKDIIIFSENNQKGYHGYSLKAVDFFFKNKVYHFS